MKKNKNLYKIILDIFMTAVLVVLMKITITGILWHELLGIGVFLLFIFHKLININTLSCLIKKFKKVPIQSKCMLILDVLLFIDFIVVVGTGILISQELFSSYFTLSNTYFVSALHHSSAYIGLILISIHIGLHWSCIINIVKVKMRLKNTNRIRTAFSRIAAVAIMFLGIQSSYNQNVLSVVSQPLNNESAALASSVTDSEDILLLNNADTDSASANTTAYNVSSKSDITLNQYLSSLFCTLCPKHCPLSSPMCSKGEALAQEATAEYYSQYGSSSSSLESDNITTDENDKDEDNTENHANGKRRSHEISEDADNSTDKSTTDNRDNDEKINSTNNNPIANAVDYVSIMGLYVGATHYIIKIPRKKK